MNMNNMQNRVPNAETRKKPEARIPKAGGFDSRISEFFRISVLEFQILTWFNSVSA